MISIASFYNKILDNKKSKKIKTWVKLVSITGVTHALVQFASLLAGILIIRQLPTNEYALYTLANTMLGTMTMLADGGIATGVISEGGKVWQNKKDLGIVIVSGLHLRKKFALYSLALAIPILFYLLKSHQASWLTSILIVASLIPTFFAALSDSIFEIVPKLHQDIVALQKNQLLVAILRLGLSSLLIFIFPWAFIAIIASGLARMYGNYKLKKIASKNSDINAEPSSNVKEKIIPIVKRIIPTSIYYCLSGQLNIWLISIFGSTMSLAGLGAISRFGMVISVFSGVFMTLVIPRFARLANDKKVVYRYFIYSVLASIIISLIMIFITILFANQVLWLLGNSYRNLKYELILSIINSCFIYVSGCIITLNLSRGWAMKPIIYIPLSIIYTIAAFFFVNVETISGVVKFNIIVSFLQGGTLFIYSLIKISSVSRLPMDKAS